MELLQKADCTNEEISEINKLEEDIRLGQVNPDGPEEKIKQEQQVKLLEEKTKPKKERKTIIRYLLEKYKKKPATWDEIQQLKLERAKAYLQRDIKLAKAQTPSKFAKGLKMLSALSNNQGTTKKKKKSKGSSYDKDSSYDMGNTDPERFNKLLGNNDPNRFKNL